MNNPLTINLYGGPGTGKSTTAAELFSILKKNNIRCEYIQEVAKDFVYEERFKSLENQVLILAKQYNRQWRVRSHVDVIITDSPLIMSKAYSPPQYHGIIEQLFHEFDNKNYFLRRTKSYQTYGRMQTFEQAVELDQQIKDIIKDLPHEEVDYQDAAKKIAESCILLLTSKA